MHDLYQNTTFHLEQQMGRIKNTAEVLEVILDWRKQTLIYWGRERGEVVTIKCIWQVLHTHSLQSPKCATSFDKTKILPVFSVSERIFSYQFNHCHYTKDQFEQVVNCRQRIYSKVRTLQPPQIQKSVFQIRYADQFVKAKASRQ